MWDCLYVGVNMVDEEAASSSVHRPRVSFAKVHIKPADESVNHTNMDIQAMLAWLTLPFYDFCGFWSVAIKIVNKLQYGPIQGQGHEPLKVGNFSI